MNRYETWLSQQPKEPSISVFMDETFVYEWRDDILTWLSNRTDSFVNPAWAQAVVPLVTETTDTRIQSRSEHRLDEDRRQGRSDFRAFLGYGQGVSRRRYTFGED